MELDDGNHFLIFVTERHKAFSKDLGIVNHASFWLHIKKEKKSKMSH